MYEQPSSHIDVYLARTVSSNTYMKTYTRILAHIDGLSKDLITGAKRVSRRCRRGAYSIYFISNTAFKQILWFRDF